MVDFSARECRAVFSCCFRSLAPPAPIRLHYAHEYPRFDLVAEGKVLLSCFLKIHFLRFACVVEGPSWPSESSLRCEEPLSEEPVLLEDGHSMLQVPVECYSCLSLGFSTWSILKSILTPTRTITDKIRHYGSTVLCLCVAP